MLSHEVADPRVSFDFPHGLRGLPPREVFSLRWGPSSSSFPWVSPVLKRVTSLLVADEAFVVPHVLRFFTGGEIDLVHIHCVGIGVSGSVSRWDVAISSSSEFPELYHISVTLSHLVEPLFLSPASPFLAIREGGSSHHDGELLGYSLLEGIY